MPWNEASGIVTASFDEWLVVDRDIRTFLSASTRFADLECERIWRRLSNSARKPHHPDILDLCFDEVGGLMPNEYDWVLQASVLKDGVTAFEVYLEKVGREVLRHHSRDWRSVHYAPRWHEVRRFYKQHLQLEVETSAVRKVRDLRHLLTHSRGELRTEAHRRDFGDDANFTADQAVLSANRVVEALETLSGVVRTVDPVA